MFIYYDQVITIFIKFSLNFKLRHGGGIIKRKSIMAVFFISILALSFSTSTAFAATNTSDTNSSQIKSTASTSTAKTFTRAQISDASSKVATFVSKNDRLPNYVTIGGKKVTMPQFLQLTTQSLLNTNEGPSGSAALKTVQSPSSSTETVKSGKLNKTEYLNLAKSIQLTINTTGKAPSSISTSLGKMNFKNMVLSYSKILSYFKTNSKLPSYVSVAAWSSTTTTTSSVKAILDKIGKQEATYEDVQGISSLASFIKYGKGDCWADSLWLYTKLQTAGITARIMGYINGGYGVGYRHAWVQINIGNGWVNWNYKGYNSQHYGDVGTGTPKVLIKSGVKNPSIVATGY